MNVLFLTQVLPYPLDAGPKVRAYYVLRRLAERHAVTLAAFVRPSDTAAAQQHLARLCRRLVTVPMPRARWRDAAALGRSLLTGLPFLITRDDVPAMRRQLAHLAAETAFDAVHTDQLWMAPYALAMRQAYAARGRPAPRLVLDQHNAVYLIPQRLAAAARSPAVRLGLRREAARMAAYEAETCLAFDAVVTVSAEDRRSLLSLYANGRRPALGPSIPICVDTSAVQPLPRAPEGRDAVFIGGMHWPPNADGVTWLAREAWPLVRARLPAAQLWAVGKQPPAAVRDQAAAGLHAPGYVADTEPYWARAGVFVAPLRAGGGLRVKILEAWARGVPVVSTTVGAEGLAARPGENLLLADTAADLAEAIATVLTDRALAQQLARSGRATVEQHYDWRTVYAAWDEIYAAGV